MAQSSGGPPALPVGTEVSAKYRGAFCEAQVKTVQRVVKCKVVMKDCQTSVFVTDEEIKGVIKLGSVVEVKHPDTGQPVEAVINKLIDNSIYTVVFDDGDERTLRRTQLCLKGDKHFIESETLDNLPLSHPEHFGTPVLQNKKAKRKVENEDSDSGDAGEEESPRRTMYRGRHQELVGKLMLVDLPHRKGTSIPALVVLPDANSLSEVKNRDQILVRSFKDSKFLVVTRKDLKEFSRVVAIKNDDKTLRTAFEKALLFHDTKELPVGWDRGEMLGSDVEEEGSGEEDDEYASEDEPFEEKDRFVAQLYKFMDDRGTPINKAPCIGNKDLNLYKLFKIVQNCGGYNKVSKEMKWPVVYSKMGLPSLHPNPAHQIKTAYKKYLDAYETFYRKLGSTMGTLSRPGRARSSNRSILNFRGREKSPRSPKPPVDKAKEETESAKVKEENVSSVDDDQDSVSVASEESDQTSRRMTPRRDARLQAANKDEAKEKKEEATTKKKEEKKDVESPKVKKEDIGVKGKKDASPGPKGKKDDNAKQKKEEDIPKKDERKSSRKMKADEEKEVDKEPKKMVRPQRKEKEEEKKEEKKEPKVEKPVDKESPKKRITRRKLLPSVEKKEVAKDVVAKEPVEKPEKKDNVEKKEAVEKKEMQEKKDVPEKKEPVEKKEVVKKMFTRETKQSEKKEKEIPRTLERRDSRIAERKETALKAAEKKEVKTVEKKSKQIGEEKKPQRKDKKKEAEKEKEDDAESDKSDNDGDSDQEKPDAASRKDIPIGSKLKVKYGRGKNQKIYIAKVVDTGKEGSHKTYLVHYAGWNTRYDEWIRPDRIVSVMEKTDGEKAKPPPPKAVTGVPSSSSSLKQLGAQKPSVLKNRASIFRTPKRTPKIGSAKTRATRSSSSELTSPVKKPGKRITRRGSALTDSADSKSSVDSHANSDVEDSASSETMEEKGSTKETEEEDEILDVEQDEDVSAPKASTATENEDSEPPALQTEEDVPEQEKHKVAEPVAQGEEISDSKVEAKLGVEKVEDQATDEVNKVVEDSKKVVTEVKPSVSEVKPEKASVTVAEVIKPISEIKSVVEVFEEQKPEVKMSKESETSLPISDIPQGKKDTEDVVDDDDDDDDDDDSPKLEIVEESESQSEPAAKEIPKEAISLKGNQEETQPPLAVADQSIPQLKRMNIDEEKPVKENEKGRGVKGRKRDSSKERKKSKPFEGGSLSEIPTLEPILSAEVPETISTLSGKTNPSPYDFDEEAEVSWQPEITKKWDPVQKVSTFKDSVSVNEESDEKEKKKVKKKTKKKSLPSPLVLEDKVEDNSVVNSSIDTSTAVSENAPSLAVSDTSLEKSVAPKKKGRKKREAESEVKKEIIEQYESSVISVIESLQNTESTVDDKPVAKKRRTKRVSESDKKDSPRTSLVSKKASIKDISEVANSSKVETDQKDIVPAFQSAQSTDSASVEPSVPEVVENPSTESAPSGSELGTRKKEASICESQGFEPQMEEPETATPFDNTPPVTPEHDEADNTTVPPDQQSSSHSTSDLSSTKPENAKAVISATITSSSSSSLPASGSNITTSKSASESPSDNDVTSTASTDNMYSVAAHQSESSGTDQDVPVTKKRKQQEEPSTQVPKKRKRVHGTRSRTAKKSPKYSMNESLSYKHSDSQGSSSATPNHCPDSPAHKFTDLSKSPRPSKFNFNADLGEYLEGEERCNFLISKMKEIKTIYMNLKSEVASIDRRRKRARRKEREYVTGGLSFAAP